MTQMNNYFPDRQHIDAISKALWAYPGIGRAAVMIGAGMSLNADSIRPGHINMPTWKDLIAVMIDRLYPSSNQTTKLRDQLKAESKATSTSLRLAEEFTAAFGRSALDDLVVSTIRDNEFIPSILHRKLLELPWSNVLTTNYDTLLERASTSCIGRNYCIVRSIEEITTSTRPRIVKLHGSFPSNRPFILSEEDFRTYPRKFAPFVNLAQQTMIENVVCLIGFSGEDPNFLYWSGWIRDNLGPYAPKIYLCGLLNLSDSQRILLHKRNVVPIDLSPLFPIDRYPDLNFRHRLAIEWFLLYLSYAEPKSPRDWPYEKLSGQRNMSRTTIDSHLLYDLSLSFDHDIRVENTFPQYEQSDHKQASFTDQIINEVQTWKHNRSIYPGWIIAPKVVRDRVWSNTKYWIDICMNSTKDLPILERIDILYEMNWRIEAALIPISEPLKDAYKEVLDLINPFPDDLVDMPFAQIVLNETSAIDFDWTKIREQWLCLAFAVMRYYREASIHSDFDNIHVQLERIKNLSGDYKARWCYERSLIELSKMNDDSVLETLKKWPDNTRDVMWSARKALVMAEIGRTDEAKEICLEALNKIRDGLYDTIDNIPRLSREGWIVSLAFKLNNISIINDIQASDQLSQNVIIDRFRKLEVFFCSPDVEKLYYHTLLNCPKPLKTPEMETTSGFDSGSITNRFNLSVNDIEKFLPALEYIRLVEETSQPLTMDSLHFNIKDFRILTIVEWLKDIDPRRIQSLALRMNDIKFLDCYLNRHQIAAMSMTTILRLQHLSQNAIEAGVAKIPSSPVVQTFEGKRTIARVAFALEMLSRLLIRENDNNLKYFWDFAFRLYINPVIKYNYYLSERFNIFFIRLIEASSDELFKEKLHQLIDLPIIGEEGFAIVDDNSRILRYQEWTDPSFLAHSRVIGLQSFTTSRQWDQTKLRLFNLTENRQGLLRNIAFHRMIIINDLGLLTVEDRIRLSQCFWKSPTILNDSKSTKDIWDLQAPYYALILPDPDSIINSIEKVKEYVLNTLIPENHVDLVPPDFNYFELIMFASTASFRTNNPKFRLRKIDWSLSDIKKIVETMKKWWINHGRSKYIVINQNASIYIMNKITIFQYISKIFDVVKHVVIPAIINDSDEISEVMNFVAQFESCGAPVGEVLPIKLLLNPDYANNVAAQLRKDVTNRQKEFFLSALRGIVYWVDQSIDCIDNPGISVPVPSDLIREVGVSVAIRHPDSIDLSLDCAYQILRRLKENAESILINHLLIGLEYLFHETSYRELESSQDIVPYNLIPQLRMRSARLAKLLSDLGYYNNPVFQSWLKSIKDDPLPEIRMLINKDLG